MTMKHPDQRIGIFIDVQNLYYSAKALYGSKVNFAEIINTATSGRKLIRAIAYTVKAEMPEEQTFFDALEKLGIEVKKKDLQTFINGSKKADWDVGIAVDMLKMAPKLDAVVLCSGDGDFQMLLHHTKAEGCRAEVISFGKSTSAKLIEESDDFIDLDDEPERYLLNNKKPFGQPPKNTITPKPIVSPKNSPATPGETHITKNQSFKSTSSLEGEIINAVNKDPKSGSVKKRRFFGK